jgi:hypothetical protein
VKCLPIQDTLATLAVVNLLHIKLEMVYFVDSSRKPVQKFCDDFEN